MILDSLFGWALNLPLWQGILALSFIITVLMNVVYAFATDQKEMKRLKKGMKDLQAEMKEHRDNQKKVMQLQKKLLKMNGEYSKKSLKPTLYTLIPILIIFGWMAANFAYAPLLAGDEVQFSVEMREPARLTIEGIEVVGDTTKETIESQLSWTLIASETTEFTVTTQDGLSVTRELVVGSVAEQPIASHEAPFKRSEIAYPKALPFGDFTIFNYKPGWLFTYIIFSVVLSILIRKIFKLS